MEQNQNRDFSRHIFNSIFSLTRHSSVFQIISWNWKHLTNHKVQAKKVFWHVMLHSYLRNALCKFLIKMFFQIIFWNRKHVINKSKQLFGHMIVKNFFSNVLRKFLIKIEGTCKRKNKEQTPQLTLLYCGRTVRSSNRRCSIRKLFLKIS